MSGFLRHYFLFGAEQCVEIGYESREKVEECVVEIIIECLQLLVEECG